MRFSSCLLLRPACLSTLILFSAAGLSAQSLNFGVLAGSPPSAGREDGSGAGGLRFYSPESVAVDGSGNIFIADFQNNTIRRVTPAGTVTTFAGLAGSPGSADGTGGAARFNGPIGLEIDGTGNLYVTDGNNNTIRKITTAGVVTTLAGLAGAAGSADGTGAAARFNFPYGLTLDGSGNLYVADANNNTIRKITPAGVVTTLAGQAGVCAYLDGTGTAAQFCFPTDLVWDTPSSTLYVTEIGNALIRKIAPGAVVSLFAGTDPNVRSCTNADGGVGVGDLCSPNNITRDSLGNFYVTDEATHNIRKITFPGGVISTFAGPNSALCAAGPAGAICPTGTLDNTGTAARFDAPEGITFDALSNSLLVTDYQSNDLRRVAVATAAVTRLTGTPATVGGADGTGAAAQFDQPFGITRIGANFYTVDFGTDTVRQITAGGVVTTLAGNAEATAWADGPGASAYFNTPRGITTNGSTLLYIADSGNRRVRTVDPVGAAHTVATLAGTGTNGNCDGPPGTGRFRNPRAVTFFGGTVYVADAGNNNIRKIDGAGNLTTFAGVVNVSCPGATSPPSPAGSADGTGTNARFNTPVGIAADGAGNIYVTDNGNSTIRMITPGGVVTTVAGSPGLPGSADGIGAAARFRTPNALSFDASGKLLISDAGNNALRKYDPATGAVTTIAGGPTRGGSGPGTGPFANFGFPRQVITDASGNYVVADGGNHAIRISAATTTTDLATIDAPYGPVGTARQLNTNPTNAATWLWKSMRQPTGSVAALSSTAIRNPTFTPDLADYYAFQVTATNGVNNATTEVALRSKLNPVILQDLVHQPSIARIGDVVLLHVQDLLNPVQLFFSNGTTPTVAATVIGVDIDRGIVAAKVPATAATGFIRLTSAGIDALPYYYRIGAGTVTTGPDQVSGTVTRASDSAPIANALVILLPNTGNNNCGGGGGDVRDAALTNGAGVYLLHGDPGSAQVVVFTPLTLSPGTVTGGVSVTLSGVPQVAPIALAAGTTVSGTVADASTGRPLAGASLNFDCKSCSFGFEVGLSDANGNFSFHIPPGAANDEKIEIQAPYKTALSYMQNNFTVGAGPTQSLGTLTLAQGITISGSVTRATDGTPISGADVSVQPQTGGNDLDRTSSAGDGSYRLTVPPNANYQLQEQTNSTTPFVDANYVSLALTTQAQLQNFPLADAGFITGIVTDSGTGLPIEGLNVQPRLASNFSQLNSTSTCSDGSYTLRVAPGGANAVVVSTQNNSCSGCNPPPPPPYADLTYKSGGNTWFYCEGTPLTLAAPGSAISGINFSTPRAATITGSFYTQASNCTTTDAAVNQNQVTLDDGAAHACGLGDTNYNTSPPAGTYQVNGLPPSSVFAGGMRACYSGGGSYSAQCSYKKLTPAYDPITVAAAGTTAANFCLGNQPTAALGNNFKLSKSGGNINLVWNASADLYHDHYRIYQATTAKPVSPPGSFPGDPFPPGTYADVFSGTTTSLPGGASTVFYLVVDTGISGNIGPSGSYGN